MQLINYLTAVRRGSSRILHANSKDDITSTSRGLLRLFIMLTMPIYYLIVFSFSVQSQVPFTAGNIVVERLGDGTAAVSNSLTNKVFLDEYTPTGTLVQTIAMPTSGSVLFTQVSNNITQLLNLSTDGRYLLLGGQNVPPGSSAPSPSTTRVIARVDYNGNIDLSTQLTSSGNRITSVTSDNGTNLWFAQTTGGVFYSTLGASTAINLNTATTRYLNIFEGQLYVSGTFNPLLATLGTGLPTTPGQTITNLSGISGTPVYQFFFADLDATVVGQDVLYAVIAGSISKYSLVGGTWVSNGSISPGAGVDDAYVGLSGIVSGSTVSLFATHTGNNTSIQFGGSLVRIVDVSGYNGALTGSHTVLATASATPNFASFKSIALVPQALPPIKVAVKTYLQGAYNAGVGRHKDVTGAWVTALQTFALAQPYNTAAFGNYTGSETVLASAFASTGGTTDITDWVLLELRDATTPTTLVASRAAFIREDGRVVDLDGISDVSFPGVTAGNYFVTIRHRNHTSVRSATALALSTTATLYDFTPAQSQAFQDPAFAGVNPAMFEQTVGSLYLMAGGNANSNANIRFTGLNNDPGIILSFLDGNQAKITAGVYNTADLNLDGTVRYTGLGNDAGSILAALNGNQAAIFNQHP